MYFRTSCERADSPTAAEIWLPHSDVQEMENAQPENHGIGRCVY